MTRSVGLVWCLGCAFIALLCAVDLAQLAQGATTADALWRRDFTNVWTGGQLIGARDWATLYDRAAFTAYQAQVFGAFGPRSFSYPPPAFPLIQLFALPPYRVALVLWLIATAALFALAARRWWPQRAGSFWLALLTPAALVNLWTAHFGFVFGALWLIAFTVLDRRPLLAGAAIGLFAMKPQLAVLIPLVLLLRGEWRAIGAAIACVCVTCGATLAVYGRAAWTEFLFGAAGTQMAFIDAKGAAFAKLSTSAATAILDVGGSWSLALTVQGVLAALGIALVTIAARHRVPTRDLALLTATATLLVLPYALAYDLTVVALGALIVMTDARATRVDRALASLGFVAPQIGIALAFAGIPLMPLMLAGLAIAQFRTMTRRAAPANAAAAHSV
ncbi:MAG: glycosyltransferase family 87 protein [Sphingomonadaceae bacterium]